MEYKGRELVKKMRGSFVVGVTLGLVLAGLLVSPVAPVAAATATGRLSATVSDPSPVFRANEAVTATFTDSNNNPVKGLKMKATWISPGRTTTCSGVTNADGVAQCSRTVKATSGQTVHVLVRITYRRHTYKRETSFVVK